MSLAAVPARIGRYEVVGRLATGGMAEVLLGRLRGPHGFERPLVIKRILPHLAADPRIVQLFLDEARIIAALHHPNLVHVHELGHDGDELFMAMEYVAGESLSGICRRLASRDEHLDVALAAHAIAEACAGLHAAHEAKSPEGKPLGVVHRDVSPQNVLVTYAGAVHVIDFGIAITLDRVGRTEAGTVRGKFEYLAPEQLQSKPLDRRVDVFALGVVLFELVSGRRLYRRGSHAETVVAILNEPIPRLRALRADVPAALEAICDRALAKDPADRYATAADLRRDLLAFVRRVADDDPSEHLAAWMRAHFGDRLEEKEAMLRRVGAGAALSSLPAAEVDLGIEIPTATATTIVSQSLPSPIEAPKSRAHRSRRLATAGALVAALGIAAWTAATWTKDRAEPHAASDGASTAAIEPSASPSATDLPATSAMTTIASTVAPPIVVASSSASSAAPKKPSAKPPPFAHAPATTHAPIVASPAASPTLW